MSSASRSNNVPVKDLKEDKFKQQQQGKDANGKLKGVEINYKDKLIGDKKEHNAILPDKAQEPNKWQAGLAIPSASRCFDWATYITVSIEVHSRAARIINYLNTNAPKFNRCIAYVESVERANFILNKLDSALKANTLILKSA